MLHSPHESAGMDIVSLGENGDRHFVENESTPRLNELLRRKGWSPTDQASPGPRGGHSCLGPLANDGAFELGHSAHDVKSQPSAGGRGVDSFAKRSEFDTSRAEVVDDADEVDQRSAQPIETPHHKHVSFADTG